MYSNQDLGSGHLILVWGGGNLVSDLKNATPLDHIICFNPFPLELIFYTPKFNSFS